MKLNRTPNPLDRNARNGENDNWDIIEGEIKSIGNMVDDFIEEVSNEALDKIVDNAKLNWKEPVDSFEYLPISANKGDTRMAKDTGKVYRYDGTNWVEIQQIDAGPVNELDSRLSSQLAETEENIRYRTSGLQPLPIQSVETAEVDGDTITPFVKIGNHVWGNNGYELYRSSDGGVTWTAWGTTPETLNNMMETIDGEMVATTGNGLYKSENFNSGSPTWIKKATPNGASQFQGKGWSLAGNGQKFMTSEYAAGSNFADSRYVRFSSDAGDTWTVVYDSVEQHGSIANESHLHGIAYDKWSDRWYLSEGHKNIAGIYVSEDDGQTWRRAEGMAIMDPSPTVIVPTDEGLVCASDHPEGGLYGVTRRDNPMEEELVKTVAWKATTEGTSGFGINADRDEETGVVYVGYRTEKAEMAPVLLAGTPTSGTIAYTWDGDFIAYDDISRVVITEPENISFRVNLRGEGATSYNIKAKLVKPGTQHANLLDDGNILGGKSSRATSLSVGNNASTHSNIRSVAIGVNAETIGTQDNVAVGYESKTSNSSSVAIGCQSETQSANSVAIGRRAITTSSNTVAIGYNSTASSGGLAIGSNTSAPTSSVIIGDGAEVLIGSGATIIGRLGQSRNNGTSIGFATKHTGNEGVTVGKSTEVGPNSTAIGTGATATHTNSVAIGRNTTTSGSNQVAIGNRQLMIGMSASTATPVEGAINLVVSENTNGDLVLRAVFNNGRTVEIANSADAT